MKQTDEDEDEVSIDADPAADMGTKPHSCLFVLISFLKQSRDLLLFYK